MKFCCINLITLIISILIHHNSASLTKMVSQSWTTFWSTACQFSTVHARTQRSIQSLPDRHNPQALFDYLFPMANVQTNNFSSFGQHTRWSQSQSRSSPGVGLEMWLDDLIDLWHSECHQRTRTRVRRRSPQQSNLNRNWNRQGVRKDEEDVTWINYMGNWSYYIYGTTTESSLLEEEREPDMDESEESLEYDDIETESDEEDPYQETSTNNDTSSGDEEISTKEAKEEETTTSTTTTATTTTAKPGDPYFSSYGGDIEYNMPLLTFTIPFDGTIVVGGFHGFKGLLPY